MCIQMPPGSQLIDGQDTNGSAAMAQLAKLLEEDGMGNVDVTRLTARIPLIMFKVGFKNTMGQIIYIDCDLSMQNPLACVNTSLLLSYSYVQPDISVLAAIIKMWAKNRDINNPSNHTLSSYGYILMLLYFLTTNELSDDGNVTSLITGNRGASRGNPIVPNLQWVEPACMITPGSTYQELKNKPSNNFVTNHPMEPTYSINTYFLKVDSDSARKKAEDLSHILPKDSLALLLASFFRFYAHDFDYKKHVVSLNATLAHGPLERESKCESDGWKIYGETLFIEDPFECFYDVAHVLKASTFRIIRKEFALAYSKVIEWSRRCTDGGKSDLDLLSILFEPITRSEPTKDETD
jgi:DNA polymerase sigma